MRGRVMVSHIGLDTFGEWVKRSRKNANISQEELAEIIGLHQISISNIERGHTVPSWQTMEALATVFDCDMKIAMIEKIEPKRTWIKGGIGRYK